MTYNVVYTPNADRGLDRLPPIVASKVMDEIDKLESDDPYELLEPWYFMYRPVGWYFRFSFDEVDAIYYFYIGVNVDPPRRTVFIEYIGVQTVPKRRPPPAPPDELPA